MPEDYIIDCRDQILMISQIYLFAFAFHLVLRTGFHILLAGSILASTFPGYFLLREDHAMYV